MNNRGTPISFVWGPGTRYRVVVWCLAAWCVDGRGDKGIAHLAPILPCAWRTICRQKNRFSWRAGFTQSLSWLEILALFTFFSLCYLTKEFFVQGCNQGPGGHWGSSSPSVTFYMEIRSWCSLCRIMKHAERWGTFVTFCSSAFSAPCPALDRYSVSLQALVRLSLSLCTSGWALAINLQRSWIVFLCTGYITKALYLSPMRKR